ncbi:hypothetical protein H5410_060786 [Solanum commersonii]|uniref:Uncharacterized protein n=1 Tax=Solanum commersonii TaxID=4109 RepID=A0A9J5W729_SOLCO|nr:hypothetical protein H5410_060786 [Solanum commersonii]
MKARSQLKRIQHIRRRPKGEKIIIHKTQGNSSCKRGGGMAKKNYKNNYGNKRGRQHQRIEQRTPSKEDNTLESSKPEPSNAKEQGQTNEDPKHSQEINTPYKVVSCTKDPEYTEGQHSPSSNISSKTMIPETKVDMVELDGRADPAAMIDNRADKADSLVYEGRDNCHTIKRHKNTQSHQREKGQEAVGIGDDNMEEEGSIDTIQQLTINFKLKGSQDRFKVIVVYARCSALERLEGTLEDTTMNTNIPWMVEGDFNTILYESENLGELSVTQNEVIGFAQYICVCALTKLNFIGSCYTWWNGMFGNNELFSLLPNSETHHLIRQGSDYTHLYVLCNTTQDQASKPFKFLNFWTKHKEFSELVEELNNIFQQIATLEDVIRVNETQLKLSPIEINKAILSKSNVELKSTYMWNKYCKKVHPTLARGVGGSHV